MKGEGTGIFLRRGGRESCRGYIMNEYKNNDMRCEHYLLLYYNFKSAREAHQAANNSLPWPWQGRIVKDANQYRRYQTRVIINFMSGAWENTSMRTPSHYHYCPALNLNNNNNNIKKETTTSYLYHQ